MPYIKQESKDDYEQLADVINNTVVANAGDLNYLFTLIANKYVKDKLNYQRINDVVGALEGAKLEFYRRVAAPYEDVKIRTNGDVYRW